MYKGKFVSELSMNEVKEYYDELRQKCPHTESQWADFNILKEKLIAFAYKKVGMTNEVLDEIRAEIERERSFQRAMDEYDIAIGLRKALEIIDKYMEKSEP